MITQRRFSRFILPTIAVGAFILLALGSGCYRRVVGERGPGGTNEPVYEPNLEEDGSSTNSQPPQP